MSYLKRTHQEVQKSGGDQTWWDQVTEARNILMSEAPGCIFKENVDSFAQELKKGVAAPQELGPTTSLRQRLNKVLSSEEKPGAKRKARDGSIQDKGAVRKQNETSYVRITGWWGVRTMVFAHTTTLTHYSG
jgi:hypothetical protein